MREAICPIVEDIQSSLNTKRELEKMNATLVFYINYIEYRSKLKWRGQDSSFIECDLQNILIRMRNDLITKSTSF